jgi:hypothetical protein
VDFADLMQLDVHPIARSPTSGKWSKRTQIWRDLVLSRLKIFAILIEQCYGDSISQAIRTLIAKTNLKLGKKQPPFSHFFVINCDMPS